MSHSDGRKRAFKKIKIIIYLKKKKKKSEPSVHGWTEGYGVEENVIALQNKVNLPGRDLEQEMLGKVQQAEDRWVWGPCQELGHLMDS